jgi:hypothetical protein
MRVLNSSRRLSVSLFPIFGFVFLALTLGACKPNPRQQKLMEDLKKTAATLEQEVLQAEGKLTYLTKEQEEFDEKNKAYKKDFKGKNDSAYNALVKAHRKVVDDYADNTAALKGAAEKSAALLEKLSAPVNFTFSTDLIEEDVRLLDTTYAKVKPKLASAMPQHEKLETALHERDAAIEKMKQEQALAAASVKPDAKMKPVAKPVVKSVANPKPANPKSSKKKKLAQ